MDNSTKVFCVLICVIVVVSAIVTIPIAIKEGEKYQTHEISFTSTNTDTIVFRFHYQAHYNNLPYTYKNSIKNDTVLTVRFKEQIHIDGYIIDDAISKYYSVTILSLLSNGGFAFIELINHNVTIKIV